MTANSNRIKHKWYICNCDKAMDQNIV